MNYKKKRVIKDVVLALVLIIVIYGTPLGCVQYAHCVNNRAAYGVLENNLSDIFEEYDGLFTPKSARFQGNHDSGYEFYITYNGRTEDFFDFCVEFFLSSQDVIYRRDRDYFIIKSKDDRYYFAKRGNHFSTDYFTDDYSALEKLNAIREIDGFMIDARKLTDEQRERLISIKDDYSFKTVIYTE
ncbi:MAG: hypothetical protein J1F09_00105 [Oscillospiraceae bacterium]|nr:hypothetical protein [Oscillospiraceae bacterium]